MQKFIVDANKNANKFVPLEIPKDYFVILNMSTQAALRITVKITDFDNIYFNESRKSTSVLPIISNTFYTKSDNAELIINVPESNRLDVRMDTMDIKSGSGILICRTLTFVAEDSNDYDYNDLHLTISCWKSQG